MTEPGYFSWFVEGRLAAMRQPVKSDMAFLAQHGVRTLVNLTHNDKYREAAEEEGIKLRTIYIPDFTPPKLKQINEFLEIVDAAEEGAAVGVHCTMGCGRTGTLLACYLVGREGYGAAEAISETRKRRPGSIENPSQEKAVHDFEQSIKKGGEGNTNSYCAVI